MLHIFASFPMLMFHKVLEGSITTFLKCDGKVDELYCKLTIKSASERILKIGQHLA